jgi:menaquinone-9 beta-reductase
VLSVISPGGASVSATAARYNQVVPRKVFDARLVDAARERGVEVRRHRVRALTQSGGEVVLDDSIRARAVVAADGANSTLRRLLGMKPTKEKHTAIAVRGYADVPESLERDTGAQFIAMQKAGWPSYAWSFPIGDGTANVGYGEVLRGAPLSRAYLLDRLAELLPGRVPDGLRAHHLPLSTHRPPPARGRALLAGDALSLINPFTGEGIFYAVLSGALAGAAAAAGPDRVAARYGGALRRRLGRHLRHSGVAAWITRRPTVVDGALRAAQGDPAVFDRLTALGLGDGIFDARTVIRIGIGLLPRA